VTKDGKTEEKKYSRKFFYIFFYQKLIFICVQATGKPSALKRELPALQKMKFINLFLCLWVIFALLDPDPIRIRIHSSACRHRQSNVVGPDRGLAVAPGPDLLSPS
jgi:hypothetical protein